LRPVPRILRNLLSRLNINCDNSVYGCTFILKLDSLTSHLEDCEHNPKRPLPCEKGCGFVIPKDELKDHNCVRELRTLFQNQQQKLNEFKNEINDQNLTINALKRELNLFKDFMRAMRVSNPAVRAIAGELKIKLINGAYT
jgi:E3 ubiquitin-protein ligase NRDP1